jgi:periplasmic copper chaperone A
MRSRLARAGAVTGVLALTWAAAAQAHISLHPNTIPAGAFANLYVRVPGEQEGAHVTKVDVLVPPGFTDVEYENVPGWSTRVIKQRVSPPIQTPEGPVSEEVSQVVWTWTGPLGRVDDSQFVQLPISLAIPGNDAGKALEFKTVQAYSNGSVVHWIDQGLDAEHPAPRINVTAPGGVLQDVAGKEAGPEAGQAAGGSRSPGPSSSSSSSEGIAIAGLAVGAIGLAAALAALLALRRARSGAPG